MGEGLEAGEGALVGGAGRHDDGQAVARVEDVPDVDPVEGRAGEVDVDDGDVEVVPLGQGLGLRPRAAVAHVGLGADAGEGVVGGEAVVLDVEDRERRGGGERGVLGGVVGGGRHGLGC